MVTASSPCANLAAKSIGFMMYSEALADSDNEYIAPGADPQQMQCLIVG